LNRAIIAGSVIVGIAVMLSMSIMPAFAGAPGDMDVDGIPDIDDNCPTVANSNQTDTDGDGTGNLCDSDGGSPLCNGVNSTIWYVGNGWFTDLGAGPVAYPNAVFVIDTWIVPASHGEDVIWGSPMKDLIKAGGGNDFACGEGDSDTLNGSFGNDWLDGGYGGDFLNGGHGHDTLHCSIGTAIGDGALDTAKGGWGFDTFGVSCDFDSDIKKQGKTGNHPKFPFTP